MKKHTQIVLITLVLTALVGSVQSAAKKTSVGCAGCKTEYFLIKHIADHFGESSDMQSKPGKTGNKKAVMLFAEGKVDFAFTCKPHWKLAAKFKLDAEKTKNWASVTIARDPIIIVVNEKSGIQELSLDQAKQVFSGKVTNWKDVSGNDLVVFRLK